jgi:hypothetical protein
MMLCLPQPAPKPSASGEHMLTLRGTSLETAPFEFQCKLWVDETGRLRIEKV